MRPKTYFHAFIQSISSAEYYQDVLRAPLWFSIRFFLISVALIGIVETSHFLVRTIPQAEQFVQEVAREVKTNYPPDLIVEWDGSLLSTSIPSLSIPYPLEFKPQDYNLPNNLAQFQTDQTDISDAVLSQYESLFVITADAIYIQDAKLDWSQTDLSHVLPENESFVLTADNANSSIDAMVEALFMTRGVFIAMGAAVMILFTLLSTIIVLCIESLLGLLLVRIYGYQLSAKKVLQMGLHVIVPAHIAHTVALIAFPALPFPILSVSFWALFVYIIYSNRTFLNAEYKK